MLNVCGTLTASDLFVYLFCVVCAFALDIGNDHIEASFRIVDELFIENVTELSMKSGTIKCFKGV